MKNQNNFREIMNAMGRIGGVAGFGISAVTPLVVCILAAVWLRNRFGLGDWVMVTAVIVGLVSAGCGAYRMLRTFLREEERRDVRKAVENPPLVPKRDPNEAWHIPEKTDSQKLE